RPRPPPLLPSAPLFRSAACLDLGDAVESLGGLYRTAEDVGSTTEDMLIVSERTDHVVGLPDAVGGSGEPAGPTSIGVYESIRTRSEEHTSELQSRENLV